MLPTNILNTELFLTFYSLRHIAWEFLVYFYQDVIFVYCSAIFVSYLLLAIFSGLSIRRLLRLQKFRMPFVLKESPIAPGISVIAPAYNEEVTIISSVRSLLTLDYPRFEVIIVNDGSTDATLEKLIDEFKLIEVDFAYDQRIPVQPVQRFFKSTDLAYDNLLVLDKINGKGKADAVNAGINAASFPYFLNTDVDCILDNDALLHLVRPFLDEEKKVIAVGATLRIGNSCETDSGMMVRVRPPRSLLARFQEIEYIRSFVIGKMGWSSINSVPNVSGGLGLFDKAIAIQAGGYDPHSLAEDMDIIVRMSRYMYDQKQNFSIRYIPQSLCWTEGPQSARVFLRQRVRWARGLWQIYATHRAVLFNPKYKKLGLIVFPYNFFFELLAPIIEATGICFYLYLIITHQINWPFAIILLLFTYTFSVAVSSLAILWDQLVLRQYKSWIEAFSLCLLALAEPILYHPLILFSALKGYFFQLIGKKTSWGNMQRKGFNESKKQKITENKNYEALV